MGHALAALMLVAAATASPAAAPATSPREVVQRAVVRVIAMLDASGLASPADRGGIVSPFTYARRHAEIRSIAEELFDFEDVARRALSVHWAARTPAERKEFVALFTDVLERAYVSRIDSYAGESIVYTGEKVDGEYAVVRSRIVPKRRVDPRRRETTLEYRLFHRGHQWRVYDVLIDGVSFVSTYRTQFDHVIQRSSYAALVERLREPRPEQQIGIGERP